MKLPEAVEWLERDYDSYVTETPQSDHAYLMGLRRTYWFRPGHAETGGPGHRQPIFTFKDCSDSWGPAYNHHSDDPAPLSPESINNPLDGDRLEEVMTRVLTAVSLAADAVGREDVN